MPASETDRKLDIPALARAVSTGFTILVVGGLAQPLVGALVPLIGSVWLTVVAVVAFGVAGWRIGEAPSPPFQGAMAAAMSYLMVLPLVVIGTGGVDPLRVTLTLAVAVGTGLIAGSVSARKREGGG